MNSDRKNEALVFLSLALEDSLDKKVETIFEQVDRTLTKFDAYFIERKFRDRVAAYPEGSR